MGWRSQEYFGRADLAVCRPAPMPLRRKESCVLTQEPMDVVESGWPIWAKLIAAPLILWHIAALLAMVLSTESGPWPEGYAHPPMFASKAYEVASRYLDPLRLQDDYRFATNEKPDDDFRVEFQLRDEQGNDMGVVRFPDPDASTWTQHRQKLIAQVLRHPIFLQPRAGEYIPPPGQGIPTVRYWSGVDERSFRLDEIDINRFRDLPRDELTAYVQSLFSKIDVNFVRTLDPEPLREYLQDMVAAGDVNRLRGFEYPPGPTPYALTLLRSIWRKIKVDTGAHSVRVVMVSIPYMSPTEVMAIGPDVDPSNYDERTLDFGVWQ